MAVGLAFTVNTISSVAVPQDVVLTVNFNVTVPMPDTFTVPFKAVPAVISEVAPPVEPVWLHEVVPPLALAAKVKAVGPEGLV